MISISVTFRKQGDVAALEISEYKMLFICYSLLVNADRCTNWFVERHRPMQCGEKYMDNSHVTSCATRREYVRSKVIFRESLNRKQGACQE